MSRNIGNQIYKAEKFFKMVFIKEKYISVLGTSSNKHHSFLILLVYI